MEITKGERIRLGLFLSFGLAAILGILFFYVGQRLMIVRAQYFTRFNESVAGLNPGAKVKWSGVEVGQVVKVEVDSLHLDYVIVHYEVDPGTPMKASLRANLVGGLSLTGLKSIELTGGDANEKTLPSGSEILAGTSQFKQLTGQAETIVLKTETLMNNLISITNDNNQANLANTLRNMSRLTANLDTLVYKNKGSLDSIAFQAKLTLQHGQKVAEEAQKIMADSKGIMEDLHKEVQGLQVDTRLDKMQNDVTRALSSYESSGKELEKILAQLDLQKTLSGIDNASKGMETAAKRADLLIYKSQEDFATSMKNLKEASENMADFSRQIKENPSLLLRSNEKQGRER